MDDGWWMMGHNPSTWTTKSTIQRGIATIRRVNCHDSACELRSFATLRASFREVLYRWDTEMYISVKTNKNHYPRVPKTDVVTLQRQKRVLILNYELWILFKAKPLTKIINPNSKILELSSGGNSTLVDAWQKSDKSQLLGRTEVLSVVNAKRSTRSRTNALSRWRWENCKRMLHFRSFAQAFRIQNSKIRIYKHGTQVQNRKVKASGLKCETFINSKH